MGRTVTILSQGSLWGVDILILVCVGASEYPFDRLLSAVDDLCDKGVICDEVIAQVGSSKYCARNFKCFDLVSREDFQDYLKATDLVITHAGTGSVVPPLKLGKKVIVFPRREKYKEHLDDHQLELADVFSKRGYVLQATSEDELKNVLQHINEFKPEPFVSNNSYMNKLVIGFIESL